eukprot:scaffold275640_cov35-Prasinocladus_malaysianus.AAC.1
MDPRQHSRSGPHTYTERTSVCLTLGLFGVIYDGNVRLTALTDRNKSSAREVQDPPTSPGRHWRSSNMDLYILFRCSPMTAM